MKWEKPNEEEEDDEEESCDSPTGQRMLAPPMSYKSPACPVLDSSPKNPSAVSSTGTGLEYGDLHRHLMSLRRGSRVSRASSGMIELVEDALGGTVVSVMPVAPNGTATSYRKWQTRAYNFLERPRGPKAIAYHVVV